MGPRSRILPALLAVAVASAMAPGSDGGPALAPESLGASPARASDAWTPFVPPLRARRAVVWAVGDGADGGAAGLSVAELIERGQPDLFLYLGDVYEQGTADEFAANYRPLFGRFDAIAAPTIGNHESANRATGYEPYWEAARGQAPPPWYSFSVAGWQFLSLDSMMPADAGSDQLAWLNRRLNRTPRFGSCRIAFTHYPRYSAGMHGENPALEPLLEALRGRARLLLGGHDHQMERRLPVAGLTQLISGAGGHQLRDANDADPGTAFVEDHQPGALRLLLRRRAVVATFVAASGAVLDSERIRCPRFRQGPNLAWSSDLHRAREAASR